MKKRTSGILMHISSLPGEYGIGDFGKEAYKFVDFLYEANQKNWQILPLGMTGYGDSPYSSFSAFAGNPYFIDLDELLELGYISDRDIHIADLNRDKLKIDYEKLYKNKMGLLRKAYGNSKEDICKDLKAFYDENKAWLREFALFMALKKHNANALWYEWEDKYKDIHSKAVRDFEDENADEIYFWIFTQYFFFRQWNLLKEYSNKKGIKIIGDIPFYVAGDSADVWANPHIFKLDENFLPITVAGCPPDAFTETGQLWGNPVYNWRKLKDKNYKWWIERIRFSFKLYDTVRIDHFRGFDAFWEVKYGDETAINGKFVEGPGNDLFKEIKKQLGDLDIIAEDLGFYTHSLGKLLAETGFPNMKVFQFAFDIDGDSDHLPHNYYNNCVAYTGTHDNHTVISWMNIAPEDDVKFACEYLRLGEQEGYNWGFIRGVWSSTAYLAVAQMQDFLGLGESSRMNEPGTMGDNWTWRLDKNLLTDELTEKIRVLTQIYRR